LNLQKDFFIIAQCDEEGRRGGEGLNLSPKKYTQSIGENEEFKWHRSRTKSIHSVRGRGGKRGGGVEMKLSRENGRWRGEHPRNEARCNSSEKEASTGGGKSSSLSTKENEKCFKGGQGGVGKDKEYKKGDAPRQGAERKTTEEFVALNMEEVGKR